MSYIIRDANALRRTAYIELYPDRFIGTHWNSNSIFLEEFHWEMFRPIIVKHFPDYNAYGFQTISADVWNSILRDFGALSTRLESGERVSDIISDISFMSEYTENEFRANEDGNLKELEATLHELSAWISRSLRETGFVSVLGM